MTTGRINQVTTWQGAWGSNPPRGGRSQEPRPPKGWCVAHGRDVRDAQPKRRPGVPGRPNDHPIAPTKPLNTGPHAGPTSTLTGDGWLQHTVIGWRNQPHGHAGERRIPRGGDLQESEFQVWSATIDPQTPSEPGAKPPSFGHRSGATAGPTMEGGEAGAACCGGRSLPALESARRQRDQNQKRDQPGREDYREV
jgi:hypothetical protein